MIGAPRKVETLIDQSPAPRGSARRARDSRYPRRGVTLDLVDERRIRYGILAQRGALGTHSREHPFRPAEPRVVDEQLRSARCNTSIPRCRLPKFPMTSLCIVSMAPFHRSAKSRISIAPVVGLRSSSPGDVVAVSSSSRRAASARRVKSMSFPNRPASSSSTNASQCAARPSSKNFRVAPPSTDDVPSAASPFCPTARTSRSTEHAQS